MFAWLCIIIFLLPLYLVKIKIFFVPFNILELMIWLVFGVWLIRKKYLNISRFARSGIARQISKYPNIILPSLLILIGAILSTLFSSDINVSAGILKGWFLAPMAFALMVCAEAKDEKSVKRLLGALFVSSAIVAVIALFYWIFGKTTFDGRLSAFYLSPNHLAMYLAPGLLIGVGLFGLKSPLTPPKGGEKLLPFRACSVLDTGEGCLPATTSVACRAGGGFKNIMILSGLIFISAVFYLTYSYAAWIAVLIVVSGQWLVISDKKNAKKLLVFGLVFVVLSVVLFLSQFGGEKMNNLLNSERSSWQSRLMIWKAALEIIKDHPVFGIGPGMFGEYYLKYQSRFSVPYLEWAAPQPHNIFLAFWLETGLLGFFGFLWLLLAFFKGILKQAKVTFSCCGTPRPAASSDSPRYENATPACFTVILAGLMIYILLHGLVDTTYFKNDLATIFWLVIALSVCLSQKTVHGGAIK